MEETGTVAITEAMVAKGVEELVEIVVETVTEKDKLSVMAEVIKRARTEEEIACFVSVQEVMA